MLHIFKIFSEGGLSLEAITHVFDHRLFVCADIPYNDGHWLIGLTYSIWLVCYWSFDLLIYACFCWSVFKNRIGLVYLCAGTLPMVRGLCVSRTLEVLSPPARLNQAGQAQSWIIRFYYAGSLLTLKDTCAYFKYTLFLWILLEWKTCHCYYP